MRGIAWVVMCALAAAVPAVGLGDRPLPVPPQPGFQPGFAGDRDYKAPKGDGAVVELLDEGVESLFPVLINDGGGEAGTITREDRDVFSGVEAVRVTPMQKYRSQIPGWSYKIVEKPAKAGEFRYIRFAWKKAGGRGLMIQLHDPQRSWAMRYHAGQNIYGWHPSTQVSATPPAEWEVVTRDMFKDWGACTISGIAFSPLDGTSACFDHMLLGRSVEDLDKATDAALGRVKPAKAMERQEREAFWDSLMGDDRVKAATAIRAFLASASDHVAFIEDRLGKITIDKQLLARIQQLLKDLDADDFDARDKATDELVKIGDAAAEAVRSLAAGSPNAEVGYRAKLVLRRMNAAGSPVSTSGRLARVVRVLERADTAKARDILTKMSEAEYGFESAPDAKAALARLAKKK